MGVMLVRSYFYALGKIRLMNPIYVTKQLKKVLIQYLLTTYDVNRDGKNAELKNAMREVFEREHSLFSGPFLELSLPYVHGKSMEHLIQDRVLSPKLRQLKHPPIPLSAPLYIHQQRAIERILSGNSVIVSSGTGSGKTEAFLIPILNDLLIDPRPGVRAVIIYPLNALVNDQLDRLRRLLSGTGITFGRYTSELAETDVAAKKQFLGEKTQPPIEEIISREQIRTGRLPQILITNYAMLEYLMLRPEDSPLFAHPEAWKFIVLDEAHSYTGAQGIEVAYLIRRLKQRLGKSQGDMRCIGTSATLTDDAQVAMRFASTLLGEKFTEEDIIFGEELALDDEIDSLYAPPVEAYMMDDLKEMLDRFNQGKEPNVDELKQVLLSLNFIDSNMILDESSSAAALYGALKCNAHFHDLRTAMIENRDLPLLVESVAESVFAPYDTEHEIDRMLALHRLIELGGYSRSSNDQSLLPARYHLFARSPQGLWACLNPKCAGRRAEHTQPWSRLFSSPRLTCDICEAAVYPLVVCRTCGQVYVKTEYVDGQYISDPENEGEIRYFAWSPIEENAALVDEGDEDEESTLSSVSKYPVAGAASHLCVNDHCRRASRCDCDNTPVKAKKVILYPIVEKQIDNRGSKSEWVHSLDQCARCHSTSRIKSDEIATPVTTSGSTPLSVLTMELYRQIPVSTDEEARRKPGAGRKLLSFYDSRQGAAQYAAFLQDVYNQDLYRYLVPEAIQRLDQKTIDLEDLAGKCAEIGWNDLKVFQNALDEDFESIHEAIDAEHDKMWSRLSSSERRRISERVTARILAELTTSRRRRQSLESLGLLTVQYFETEPDVADLAHRLKMSETQTRNLIDYLLETLRDEKAIRLPDGIARDDMVFGKHQVNPTVVRGNHGIGEIRWVGATERHRRCRIMKSALQVSQQPDDYESIRRALELVWEWLTDSERDVFIDMGNGAYQLSYNRMFFHTYRTEWSRCIRCQRLRHGAIELPCPAMHCDGKYQPVDRDWLEQENYYFTVLAQKLNPMRVEEHTAQLSSELGREYQNQFKRGDINILSCSTTFEMGIDLGDLQAVVMNNVPPNVSNYRQRAGRAGRRAGGTAFITTWASNRPHDQGYFENPPEIIRGHVRIPRLLLTNPQIRRRHVNAVLLADFLRFLQGKGRTDLNKVGPFFDPHAQDKPHVSFLENWWQTRKSILVNVLADLAALFGQDTHLDADESFVNFKHDLNIAKSRYEESAQYYRDEIDKAYAQHAQKVNPKEAESNREKFDKLLERLNNELLINTLSDRGVLPSYSFPLYTVELELPYRLKMKNTLRLQRDLRQAIVEYAPGSEVVADKRLWVSGGVRILRDAPQVYSYRLCPLCNHLLGTRTAGEAPIEEQACPICHTPYPSKVLNARYLVPDGFRAKSDSGKSAGQYVRREAKQQSVAVFIPAGSMSDDHIQEWVTLKYNREGRLYYLNGGKTGFGYTLCMKCGAHVAAKNPRKCPTPFCPGDFQQVNLGHEIKTDILSIRFDTPAAMPLPSPRDQEFWYTLETALALGATRALQIERGDIGGTLFPFVADQTWQQSIVLFDNVPGGAGYMRDIQRHFREVVQAALEIVRCQSCDEETSCTHCLRDYTNQVLYPYLVRGRVIRFLENLHAVLGENVDPLGITRVYANNPAHTFAERISKARHSIRLAVSAIEDERPIGERDTWLDLLHDRLRAGVKVELLLTDPPIPNRADHKMLKTADYLQVLMNTGALHVRKVSQLPDWHLIVDGDASDEARAFQFVGSPLKLDEMLVQPTFKTTTQKNGIESAKKSFDAAWSRGKAVTAAELEPPPNTRVYRIPSSGSKHEEGQIPAIRDFFALPVVEMVVVDPYLIDRERIINRLGAYIRLAEEGGALKRVVIETRDAQTVQGGDRETQSKTFEQLKKKSEGIAIDVKRSPNRDMHDRWIKVTRADGIKATMYIGRGLDFIRADGSVQSTYIVVDEGG